MIIPDDNLIDFPCSYSWRAYYEETIYGRYLLPIDTPHEENNEGKAELVVRHIIRDVTPQLKGQLRRDLEDLRNDFNEHTKHLSPPKRKDEY